MRLAVHARSRRSQDPSPGRVARGVAPGRRPAGENGFVTMTVLILATVAFLVLSLVIENHYQLLNANRRLARQIQERASALAPQPPQPQPQPR